MDIDTLCQTCQKVMARFYELDHEQFDKVKGCNTRPYFKLWEQACDELVPDPAWRPVVSLICQGASYYGLCEEWFEG